jgi:hypothetical protein
VLMVQIPLYDPQGNNDCLNLESSMGFTRIG